MASTPSVPSLHVVKLQSDEIFMWKGHQKNLCRRIRQQQQQQQQQNSQPVLLKLHWPCHELHQKNRHGNLVLGIYAMYVAAMAHENVFLDFQCQEKQDSSNLLVRDNSMDNTVFSWVQHSIKDQWGALQLAQATNLYSTPPTRDLACKGMGRVPLFYASELFRSDMRRMARSIQQEHPLADDSKWDQVAIHFRCGDILSGIDPHVNENYGMVAFRTYLDAIESSLIQQGKGMDSITTIGIVTAPFDKDFLRSQDARHASECTRIVLSLQDYLVQHFPTATVSVRNDPKETIPEVFSRLILADYSICIRSTFCLIPTLSTFGHGILLDGGVTRMFQPISDVHSNIEWLVSANTPYLLSHQIQEMGVGRTLEWLLGD